MISEVYPVEFLKPFLIEFVNNNACFISQKYYKLDEFNFETYTFPFLGDDVLVTSTMKQMADCLVIETRFHKTISRFYPRNFRIVCYI